MRRTLTLVPVLTLVAFGGAWRVAAQQAEAPAAPEAAPEQEAAPVAEAAPAAEAAPGEEAAPEALPLVVASDGPRLSLPVCDALPFDAAAFVRDLQVALAYHRAEVAARGEGPEADPAALALTVETRCAPTATHVVVEIDHLRTGRSIRGRISLEGDTAEVRGQWLARATTRLLEERWSALVPRRRGDPNANPYRIALYDSFPANPYRGVGDFVPEANPYSELPSAHSVPVGTRAHRRGEDQLSPANPYRG